LLQALLLATLLLPLYGLHAMLKAARQGLHHQLRQAALWHGLSVLIVPVAPIARLAPLVLELAPVL